MSEPSDSQLNYQHYLSLDRPSSLRLGITGRDEPANAQRLAFAQRLREEHSRIEDAAYGSAHWMREPDIAKPFGLELIIKHHGDVFGALEDAELRDEVRDHLGYRPHDVFINDEDGQRWAWYDGGQNDSYVQAEIDAEIIELKGSIYGVPEKDRLDEIADRWTACYEEAAKKEIPWRYRELNEDHHALRLDS